MSVKIEVSFEITSMLIMEETLKRLGYDFTQNNNELIIKRPFYDIVITKEKIFCDSIDRCVVDKIKYEYQRDFITYERVSAGENFEIKETADEIIFLVG